MADSYGFARLRRDLAADIEAYLGYAAQYSPARPGRLRQLSALLTPSVTACAIYRLSHWAQRAGWLRCAAALAYANLFVTRVSIAPASRIGGGLYIAHPSGIMFQGEAGQRLQLYAGSGAGPRYAPLHAGELHQAPVLGDDVAIGAKAFVCGPVRVGSGARIGFNAWVDTDLPAGARVASAHVRNTMQPRAAQPSSR